MLRRFGDRGEGSLSYLTVILLIGAVLATVTVVAIPEKISAGISAGICRVTGDKNCGKPSGQRSTTAPTGPGSSPSGQSVTGPPGQETPERREYREALDALNKADTDLQQVEKEWNEFDLLKEIGKLGLDFIAGDIVNCLKNPNLSDCLWALLDVVPWGKLGKLLKSIPKAAKLLDRLMDLKRRLEKARDARKNAKKRVDDALDACKKRQKPGSSFLPGTQVVMADGSRRPIERVRIGDLVWASDPATGRSGPREVTRRTTSSGLKNLSRLTVDLDGELGGETARITATANHPFRVAGADDWIDAGRLVFGDELATSNGDRVLVLDTHRRRSAGRVHNLTVADFHTYYVVAGNTEILVHNDPADPNKPDPNACSVTPPAYQTPAKGTPEYQQRHDELSKDPAHNDKVSDKTRREAEVGLEMERRGVLPGPIKRAPKINGLDSGDFVDANGQHWDVKAFKDIFPAGRNKGQKMTDGQPGKYNRQEVEEDIKKELASNPPENVIIDPEHLSPEARKDLQSLVDSHPEWKGKVVFL
ncbi:polymorphic toxin-type HINT domain-containing protein [Actinomadura kijaniata]|uniref:polymorphic toxin-type HINT domain-containing protein n=1 Tax=Actinomadura kijaniata TaxID=46161 RepID=UPI00082C8A34|nr:polymorphic toxin-type HINT domain-containing protein [Actinomadura kijaniata]